MTSYREAGVDLDGAGRHVKNISDAVTSTWTDDVIGGFGGFAAGVQIPNGYTNPILMMSTDGVGTKLELARRTNQWAGVGHDLVAMCVDDLAAVGAQPIGFVDYMAVGALDESRDTEIVTSIAAACGIAGCPLLGGETAEHPGVMNPDAIDLAGAVMGVVEKGQELGPDRVVRGDLVIGLVSPNLRSNGFSLIRSVLGDSIDTYADQLLEPSVIYSRGVLSAVERGGVRGGAHITGGGLADNLARTLPKGLGAEIDTDTWERPEVFGLVGELGVGEADMWHTFNMGIGFCLVVDPEAAPGVITATQQHDPRVIGQVADGSGVQLS